MPLKWGIASCCKAACDFAEALNSLPEEEHLLISIGSANEVASEEFSRKYQVPNYYGTYELFAADPDVDIVFVAVVIPYHFEITKMCISMGKHVICEKPLCFCEKMAKELMILAKVKKVFLMEAMWSKCFPAMDFLMEELENGVIGDVQWVDIKFGKSSYNKKDVSLKEIYKGVIMDFGLFALSFQDQIFRNIVPTKVMTSGHLNHLDVDESATCIMNYPEGKTTLISIHTRVDMPNEATIIGTKGTIKIPHFWFPTKLLLPTEEKVFPLLDDSPKCSRKVAYKYLIAEATSCIKEGKLESDKCDHASTLQVIHFMEMWRTHLKVVFVAEENVSDN